MIIRIKKKRLKNQLVVDRVILNKSNNQSVSKSDRLITVGISVVLFHNA